MTTLIIVVAILLWLSNVGLGMQVRRLDAKVKALTSADRSVRVVGFVHPSTS